MTSIKTRLRVGVLLAFLTAITTGVSVAPAAAAPSKAEQSANCNPLATEGAATFSLFGASSVAARGADVREPDLGEVHAELPATAKGKAGKNFRQSVPVWFHVVSDGEIGNISDTVIQEQMNVLNLAFGGFYGGANTGFSFKLAGVTRTDNAAWHYAGIGGTDGNTMKRTLHRGGPETLNIYATTAAAYLGWAYLPDIVTKPGQEYLDGIVVDWESMPGASTTYAGKYDLGQTATHEAGHWINLEHTFFGGCNAKGDFVDDTPAQKVPTNGCPEGQDTCREAGLDPIHNYMDYSYDSCYWEFTAGQTQRMRDAWLLWRA
jgi:hypothetical protein